MHSKIVLVALLYFLTPQVGSAAIERQNSSNPEVKIALMGQKSKTLDPVKARNFYDFLFLDSTCQRLVKLDPSGRIVGDIAKEWMIQKNGKDYIFYLKNNLKFSDGTTVNANDIVFSFARHGWRKSPSGTKGYLEGQIVGYKNLSFGEIPSGLKAINDKTVKISLNSPNFEFLSALTMLGLSVISKSLAVEKGEISGSGNFITVETNKGWKLVPHKNLHLMKNPANVVVDFFNQREVILDNYKKYDVILGVTNIDEPGVLSNFIIQPLQSLGVANLIINSDSYHFSNTVLRSDFSGLVKWLRNNLKGNSTFSPIDSLIPKMVVPIAEQIGSQPTIEPQVFIKKWLWELGQSPIRVALLENILPAGDIDYIKRRLAKYNKLIKIEIHSRDGYTETLRNKNYDFALFGFALNYPSPSGYLSALTSEAPLGNQVDFSKYVTSIYNALEDRNPTFRNSKILNVYREIDNIGLIIPMYQVHYPVARRKNITLPDSRFRFNVSYHEFQRNKQQK